MRMTAQAATRGQQPISRFAPSPTGWLHIGHAVSAILAHDFARERGGQFVLRIEDCDVSRCRPEFTDAIFADLAWLGLTWDGVIVQSARLALYNAALLRLKAQGVIYPCFCSRAAIAAEAAASLHAPHGADGPLYPGTCRTLGTADRARRCETERHNWRLDAAAAYAITGPVKWLDGLAGSIAVDIHALGDVIVKGRDRPASYHLAVVIDDAAQGITDVVRGRDIFASTHAHRLLQALLGLPTPRYHHHPLVIDATGTRLAKRNGAPALSAMREAGENGAGLADRLRKGALPIGFAPAAP